MHDINSHTIDYSVYKTLHWFLFQYKILKSNQNTGIWIKAGTVTEITEF
jgi:hypothetical protein